MTWTQCTGVSIFAVISHCCDCWRLIESSCKDHLVNRRLDTQHRQPLEDAFNHRKIAPVTWWEAHVSKRSDSDCSCLETGFFPPGDRCSHQVMESDHPEVKGVTFESLGNHLIAAVCNQSETAKRINTITEVCRLTRALFPSSLSSNFGLLTALFSLAAGSSSKQEAM